jgi:hypothetical protein
MAAVVLGVTLLQFAPPAPAQAASGSDFIPGYIISDDIFFNYNAMSEAAIQNWLNSQSCTPRDGVPCLRNYVQNTTTQGDQGAGHCTQYTGAGAEPASRIIFKVAQACRINPMVLLVLLQKEQTLITSPSSYGYQRATGYACPDTAACDARYFGFFNQVYHAAWQFRQYTLKPSSWRYRVGNVAIQWSPNAACGSSIVNIQNQATANLYNYTPYQPNAAALSNVYGTGDGCSAYGNRNFWRMFSDWFGSPIGSDTFPVGYFDSAAAEGSKTSYGAIHVKGWVVDKWALTSSLPVRVFVDNQQGTTISADTTANTYRPDVDQVTPGWGVNHGYDLTIPISGPGQYKVCVFAFGVSPVSSGKNPLLGCIYVDGRMPVGYLDSAKVSQTATGASLTVRGWDADYQVPAQGLPTDIYITDPSGTTQVVHATANKVRSDVGAIVPGIGPNHGYEETVPITKAGTYQVCVFALGQSALNKDKNPGIGCTSVSTASSAPNGILSTPTFDLGGTAPSLTVSGWAVDNGVPDLGIPVHVYVTDPTGKLTVTPTTANVATATKGNHGYSVTSPLTRPGTYQVCTFALGTSYFNKNVNPNLGCANTFISSQSPIGYLDHVTASPTGLYVNGWAYDTGGRALNIPVHLYVTSPDGRTTVAPLTANTSRPDVAGVIPGAGANHGYETTIPITQRGKYTVCAYALGATPLSKDINPQLGCMSSTY